MACKVARDEKGASKGHGCIYFETEKDALSAIDRGNGMLLAGMNIIVEKSLPKSQAKQSTDVFVKNIESHFDEDKLIALFSKYGEITRCVVMKDEDGNAKGFGFVAFAEAEDAQKAVEALHNSILDGTKKKLFVVLAEKKNMKPAKHRKKGVGRKTPIKKTEDNEERVEYC